METIKITVILFISGNSNVEIEELEPKVKKTKYSMNTKNREKL